MVAVHVGDDLLGGVGEGIRRRRRVTWTGDPVHRRESAHEVDVRHLETPEAEVLEVDPVGSPWLPDEVPLARGSPSRFWVCMAMLLMRSSGAPRSSGA